MGLALFLIGAAAIHWAKKLMPDVEIVQESLARGLRRRGTVAPCSRSTSAASTRAASSAAPSSSAAWSPRSAWPASQRSCCCVTWARCPSTVLRETMWEPGMHILIAETHQKIRPEDMEVGTLVSAVPEGIDEVMEEEGNLNALAKAAVMLIKMDPTEIVADQTPEGEEPWTYEGSCASRRSAPTSAARWVSTSSSRTTCSARATSPPSTSLTPAT